MVDQHCTPISFEPETSIGAVFLSLLSLARLIDKVITTQATTDPATKTSSYDNQWTTKSIPDSP